MITVSCEVTKADVLALACHYYAKSPTVRRQLRINQITSSLASGILAFFLIWKTDGFAAGVVMFFLIGMALAVMLPKYLQSRVRQSAEKMIAESSYRKAFGRYTLVFTDQGIAASSPIGESNIVWDAVDQVSITPDYLFIFLAGPHGLAISRAQAQESTIAEVKAYVEAHIAAKPTAVV
jgi:hypothetical protein